MRRILALASIIVVAFYSCKKDPKINLTGQLAGTWSLYSVSNSLNMQNPIATSADYPCMSDDKMIFNPNGSLILPPLSKCYISPKDAFGNASSISRDNGVSGKWSLSGSSVYTTVYDSTVNATFIDHFVLSNNNGQLQLKNVDSVYSGALISLYIKQ